MALREINSEDIAGITQAATLTIVDCYATWCGPCSALKPRLEAVCEEYKDKGVDIVALDVDKNESFAKEHEIRSIPTLLFYKSGEVVHTMHGVPNEKRICDKIEQLQKA
jgi:thioredoxin 1